MWRCQVQGLCLSKIGIPGDTPKIIHFNRVFPYKPSILGYHYFWKHPYRICPANPPRPQILRCVPLSNVCSQNLTITIRLFVRILVASDFDISWQFHTLLLPISIFIDRKGRKHPFLHMSEIERKLHSKKDDAITLWSEPKEQVTCFFHWTQGVG